MSGPKVVRIVTREERIALGEGQLRRLEAAGDRWARACRAANALTDEEEAATRRRRDTIEELLRQDRFAETQLAVTEEIAFLKADREARLTVAATAAARARTLARREAEVRTALAAAGPVQAAATAAAAAETAARLQALAQALKEAATDSRPLSVVAPPGSAEDAAMERIEARLAEMSAFLGAPLTEAYERRLETVRGQLDEDRRALLLDSISLDVGKALVEGRALAALREDLALLLAELADAAPQARAAFGELDLETLSADACAERLSAVRDRLEAARAEAAATARRAAVLQGLAALGYEVTEGLSTAWVKEGRVVLHRPAQPGYGVELAGGADAQKLQMQVVAFGGQPDPARDRDAETRWCGDVAGLKARFAAAGAELVVERALEVGARPVKRVEADERFAAREGATLNRERGL